MKGMRCAGAGAPVRAKGARAKGVRDAGLRILGIIATAMVGGMVSGAVRAADDPPPAAPVANAVPPEGAVGGLGDVNLFPKRVVLDDRQRVATIGLYNRSAGSGDYEIAITDRAMTPGGDIVDLAAVTDPALKARVKTAADMLRWSPRRVVLQGNEAQTVRVMARLPEGLPPGEYRAHFSAVAVPPDVDQGLSIADAAGNPPKNAIGVKIVPRFGISIPVIVRVGETTLTVGLASVRRTALPDGRQALALAITRGGTRSAFGDITVTAPGAKGPLAVARGVGIYPEVDGRTVTLPLNPAAGPLAPGARVTVTYTDDDFAPGQTLAKQDFTVP